MSKRPAPPRGMRDLLPKEVMQRAHLLERIVRAYELYGFEQIETPLLEEIHRLVDSEGGDNAKLIYEVLKRGIDWPPTTKADAVDLGLRYDLTVPLARFYTSHSTELASPFKAIQAGQVFRAERPQKGRYRQFAECDIDVIGESDVLAEIELVCATAEALKACEVGDFVFRMNDRRLLDSLVAVSGFDRGQTPAVLIALDKYDKIGVEGVATELAQVENPTATAELIRVLEAVADARGFDATIAAMPDGVDVSALDDLQAIEAGVQAALPWVKLELDTTLVRGQGYYTGAIFEVEHTASSGSLAGGGRYDRMIGKISGVDVPACGLSIGFERLWDFMGENLSIVSPRRVAYIYEAGSLLAEVALGAQRLREQGDIVRTEAASKNRKAQLNRLSAGGFTHWARHDQPTIEAAPIVGDN